VTDDLFDNLAVIIKDSDSCFLLMNVDTEVVIGVAVIVSSGVMNA
jgi:hypothetical protein